MTIDNKSILIAGCLLSALYALVFNLLPINIGSAAEAFGLTYPQMGTLGSLTLGGWVIGSLVAFALLNHMSWQQICTIGAVLSGIGFIASAQVSEISHLNVTWFVAGLGAGLPFSIAIQALGELDEPDRVMGMKLASEVFLGAALLYLFPVLLIANWAYDGAAYGIAAMMLIGILAVSRMPRTHRTVASDAEDHAKVSFGDNLPAIAALVTLAIFFGGQTGIWTLLERIGNTIGLSGSDIGISLAVVKILGFVAGATAAVVGAKYGSRWPHVLGLICIGGGLYMVVGASGFWAYAVGSWIWEFGFALSQVYQMAGVAALDRSRHLVVLIPAGLGVGAALGPMAAGSLVTAESFMPVAIMATACSLLATVVFSIVMSKRQRA